MNDAWIGVIGALGGASIGIIGQMIASRINHTRELAKISYEKKYSIYQELIKIIDEVSWEITKALCDSASYPVSHPEYRKIMKVGSNFFGDEIDIRDTETGKINEFVNNNTILIPSRIQEYIKESNKKIYEGEYYNPDKQSLIELLRDDLEIKSISLVTRFLNVFKRLKSQIF